MMLRLFNCPLDGNCIWPSAGEAGRSTAGCEGGRTRVCVHFRADGRKLYCAYAREEQAYPMEGPIPAPTARRGEAVTYPDAGFWSRSYVSRRRRRSRLHDAPDRSRDGRGHVFVPVPREDRDLVRDTSL